MTELMPVLVAFALGLPLGIFYFGGLWLTLRRLPTSQFPIVLLLGSLLFRMIVTLLSFYFIMAGRWENLLASLAGFTLMRFVVSASTRSAEKHNAVSKPSASV